MVSLGYGDAHEIELIAYAGVHQHSCLAKEDPDNGAFTWFSREGGALHERWPLRLIRPTLSACCDESQLLLGIPPHTGGSTNRGFPTAQPALQCPEAWLRRLQNRASS